MLSYKFWQTLLHLYISLSFNLTGAATVPCSPWWRTNTQTTWCRRWSTCPSRTSARCSSVRSSPTWYTFGSTPTGNTSSPSWRNSSWRTTKSTPSCRPRTEPCDRARRVVDGGGQLFWREKKGIVEWEEGDPLRWGKIFPFVFSSYFWHLFLYLKTFSFREIM